jgi:hypothetical protein
MQIRSSNFLTTYSMSAYFLALSPTSSGVFLFAGPPGHDFLCTSIEFIQAKIASCNRISIIDLLLPIWIRQSEAEPDSHHDSGGGKYNLYSGVNYTPKYRKSAGYGRLFGMSALLECLLSSTVPSLECCLPRLSALLEHMPSSTIYSFRVPAFLTDCSPGVPAFCNYLLSWYASFVNCLLFGDACLP